MVTPKQQLQDLRLSYNWNLMGSLPDVIGLIARGACGDFSLDLAWNRFHGTFPEQILIASSLARFIVYLNVFTGSLPDATCLSSRLRNFDVTWNRLMGSLPDVSGFMARGGSMDLVFFLSKNSFKGTLPEAMWSASRLVLLAAPFNLFTGSLPDAAAMPSRLASLGITSNKLTGKMPDGLRYCSSSLTSLALGRNRFEGLLPESLGMLTSIEGLSIDANRVAGHIPAALGHLQRLKELAFGSTQLSGPLPEVWSFKELQASRLECIRGTLPSGVMLRTATRILLSDNNLAGTIPESLYSCSLLDTLSLRNSRLLGRLPDRVGFLRRLRVFAISSTKLSGALPSALGSLLWMSAWQCADTFLMGSMPLSLSQWKWLESLETGRSDRASAFEGRMPGGLARARRLSLVTAQRNRLEGTIPEFVSTLRLLAMHKNRFRRVSNMKFGREGTAAVIFDNWLSCHLPSCGNQAVNRSVVALGNHLAAPKDKFPSWVMPYEKNQLFWVASRQGRVILMSACTGVACLLASVKGRMGLHRCLQLMLHWHSCGDCGQRVLVDVASSLLRLLGLQVLWSCLERLLFLEHGFYDCPGFLAFMSSGFSQERGMQAIIVLIWIRFLSYASRPFWLRRDGALLRVEKGGQRRGCLLWVAWLFIVLLVSGLAVLNVMTKCVPGFLQGEDWSMAWVTILNGCIGLCQGVASSSLIPAIAGKMAQIGRSKYALVSIASLVVTCLSPAAVVLYVDSACLGRWVCWWEACRNKGNFNYIVPCKPIRHEAVCDIYSAEGEIPAMKHSDICIPGGRILSVSKCAQAMTLKLQALLLAKLISSGLPFVAGRLLTNMLYRRTSDVFLKFSLLLEMGLFVGAPLPLVILFLATSVLGDQIVAAVAWHKASLKANILKGTARTSIAITGLCSFLLHLALVHEDSAVVTLLLLLAAQRTMTMIVHLFKRQRQQQLG